MRRRLITSTLAVVLVVIAVFGLSLVIVETRTITNSAQERVDSEAVRLVSIVDSRLIAEEQITSEILRDQVEEGRYAVVRLRHRAPIEIGDKPRGDVIKATERGEAGESVTVEEPRSEVTREVGRTLMIIGLVALLAIIAAALLAIRQGNRLAAPLTDLAETAERLGSGDPRPRHKRYGVPELDRIAEVLDGSAERIARMLTAERRLAADASHQLRTPLTALSMRLEEITLTGDIDTVQEEANIAINQVERLTAVVERLLTNSRDPRNGSAVPFELDEVVKQQVEEWLPAYRGRGACHRPLGPPPPAGRRHPGRGRAGARRAHRELAHARRRHGRAAHPRGRQPGRRRGHRRGPRGAARPRRAHLRAHDLGPELDGHRPRRRA
ncbi:His Kinase A (phospho-acceptor) domain-containing protein [Streptomyces sp. DfronAA-171]|nr:His Kinase A (phospho-acceptor) domain-containing protein [Streptomyces sp. DfronAA-171]